MKVNPRSLAIALLCAVAVIFSLALKRRPDPKPAPEIVWLGRIVFAEERPAIPYWPVSGSDGQRGTETGPQLQLMTLGNGVEIGLRTDGVCVWRKAP